MPYAAQFAPRYRKAARNITDRAKRYRANRTPPPGPRRCELCGSTRFLVVDHRDGDESNNRQANKRWLCKSCNTRTGAAQARRGSGIRTRQYNPWPAYAAYQAARERERIISENRSRRMRGLAPLPVPPKPAPPVVPVAYEPDGTYAGTLRDPSELPAGYTLRWERAKNPGADNLAAYTEAVLAHQRGQHDWGGAIIHETPLSHRQAFAREIWNRRRGGAPRKVILNPKKIIRLSRGLGTWKLSADYTGGYYTSTPFPSATDFETVKAAVEKLPIAQGYEIRNMTKGSNPRRRSNPLPLEEAAARYEKFHGEAPREILDAQRSDAVRKTYWALGPLDELEIAGPDCDLESLDLSALDSEAEISGTIPLDFTGDGVTLAADPRGHQLYLLDGAQALDAEDLQFFGADARKDLIDLGPVVSLTYQRRAPPDYHVARYRHFLGEHSGQQPIAVYDRIKGEIGLVGGTYRVKDWIYD